MAFFYVDNDTAINTDYVVSFQTVERPDAEYMYRIVFEMTNGDVHESSFDTADECNEAEETFLELTL